MPGNRQVARLFYCETQISKTMCIEICKSNNPAQRRVMNPKFQKHSETRRTIVKLQSNYPAKRESALKHAGLMILHKHGYNSPQSAAEFFPKLALGSIPVNIKILFAAKDKNTINASFADISY